MPTAGPGTRSGIEPDPITPPADDRGAEPDALSGSGLALALYRARITRARRRYTLIVCAVIAALAIGVTVAWVTGEAHDAKLTVATTPDPAVADEPLAQSLAVAWTSTDTTAGGSYSSHGTVVTYSAHTVAGRSALTGDVRWSYTRSDVTVCGVDTQDGIAVAIFDLDGNCDEAIGLDVATGARRWNRTLMDSGTSTMTSRPSSVSIVAAKSVHVISPGYDATNVPSGGLDRWNYVPSGCTIQSAVLGGLGVLVAQSCAPDAPFLTSAAAGAADAPTATGGADSPVTSLVLRKPFDDGFVWTITANGVVPVLVTDSVVLGWDPTAHTVVSYSAAAGKRDGAAILPGCTADTAPKAIELSSSALLWCAGTLSKVTDSNGQLSVAWSMAAAGLPAVQSSSEGSENVAIAPTAVGLASVNLQTGALIASAASSSAPESGGASPIPASAQSAVAAASRLERFGSGLLVAGAHTVMLGGS
jgi:hypothetical protein